MNEVGKSGWTPCERGELTQLVSRLAFRKRLVTLAVAGSVLAAASGLGAITWYVAKSWSVQPATDDERKPFQTPSIFKVKRS